MSTRPLLLSSCFVLLAAAWTPGRPQEEPDLVIDATFHHLGNDLTPEWPEAPAEPEGARLELRFESAPLAGEATLALRQRDVDDPWSVRLNGETIATLARGDELRERWYVVPPGALVAGENVLVFESASGTDDMVVGDVRLWRRPLREALGLRTVTVTVLDAATGEPIPARVAVTDREDGPATLFDAARDLTAVREGLVYTADGTARFEVPAGEWRLHVSRGMEWSLVRRDLTVTGADVAETVTLVREVDTTGWVACDTHVHTLTYSGHGDSSVEERLVTLAGEGVELAIATDHNHNTDYRPLQRELGLEEHFTPVVGNEVTTPIGHFNAFPLDPADTVPPHETRDVAAIVAGCRERGARAVILNHPRWPDFATGPFGEAELDRHTGATRPGVLVHDYDALELINSDTEEPDPLGLFLDWFSLLDRGEALAAVASSDSHAVGVTVGQGRTYVSSASDDPADLDVEACADAVAGGRTSLALGIFVELTHRGRSVMGRRLAAADLAGEPLRLRVASPSWVRPELLQVWSNGDLLHESELPASGGKPTDLTLELPAVEPGHDRWIVCLVRGPDAGGPHWPQRNAYVLGATNPVFVDGDGDGRWLAARPRAAELLADVGDDPARLRELLAACDPRTAVHLVDLVRERWMRAASERALALGESAAGAQGPALRAWLDTLR